LTVTSGAHERQYQQESEFGEIFAAGTQQGMARTHIEVVDQDLEVLADVRRLINEQFRALQGRLSDADLTQCTLRAERIKQLLEAVRHSSSQPALVPPERPTPG